jgi:predicted nuclease of restriction endonuclease-like (RecB) superfamily
MSLTSGRDQSTADYHQLLEEVLTEVRAARVRAGQAVNAERTLLYWRIGRLILERQQQEGWGATIIDRLAADLGVQFPGMRGWSPRNLWYMRALAEAYPTHDRATAVAGLPWGHLTVLMSQVPDPVARAWYIEQTTRYGWSRSVLTHHIGAGRFQRVGQAPDNFTATVPVGEQDLVREVLADPYDLEFLALDPAHSERQLEDALVAKLSAFLTELGQGFAFVGRQYRLPVGDREFFADLVSFHLGLRRFIVFELKVGPVEPEHLGKLSFYVTAVDEQLRRPEHGDGPTIGILLAGHRDDVVVEYALRTVDAPLAVATYTTDRTLPADLRAALPSSAEFADLVTDSQ